MEEGLKKVKDEMMRVLEGINKLRDTRVLVGVPQEGERKFGLDPGDTMRKETKAIDNATLAYIHDNGAPEANIPPRPFLLEGLKEKKDEIAQRLYDAGTSALDGNHGGLDKNLHAAGLVGQAAVRHKITEGPFTPLAPATIAARRARTGKSGGERPLIDTGQLRASIAYVIRVKGKPGV